MSATKCFGYLRVSGKGQIDGDGFPRQRAAIKAYADAHGMRVVRWFEEKGVSGTLDLENRPALQELLTALHSNGVTTVLCEKLDRLARHLVIQESILADMKRNGFEVISVTEPDMCSDDPTRVLMRQILGAFAQYEKSMIVLKLAGARERMRKKTGRCEGRKAFGHRPGEQEIIDRMRALATELIHDESKEPNYSAIAVVLNAEGVPTRAGGTWYASTVSGILARETQRT